MPKKVLIVDDDLYIRELYEEVLQQEGYEVDTASDGKEGLELIQKNPYDLILLDVMLPQLDGLGILTTLQESKPAHPIGPIILLTNLSHDPALKEALQKGAHSVAIKTDINPDELVVKIKEVLGDAEKPSKAEAVKAADPEDTAEKEPSSSKGSAT